MFHRLPHLVFALIIIIGAAVGLTVNRAELAALLDAHRHEAGLLALALPLFGLALAGAWIAFR